MTQAEDGSADASLFEEDPTRIGHAIPGRHGGTLKPIVSSAMGRDLARRRWDKAENVALRALRDRAGGSSWAAGWLQVIEAQLGIATSGGKGSTPAAVFVGRAAGLLRERTPGTTLPEGAGAVVVLSESATAGVAAALASYLKK